VKLPNDGKISWVLWSQGLRNPPSPTTKQSNTRFFFQQKKGKKAWRRDTWAALSASFLNLARIWELLNRDIDEFRFLWEFRTDTKGFDSSRSLRGKYLNVLFPALPASIIDTLGPFFFFFFFFGFRRPSLITGLRPKVKTRTSLVPTTVDKFIFRTLLGVTKITQCRTPAQSPWKSPIFFVYDPSKSTLTSSNDPNKSTPTSPRVLHTFSSTNDFERKKKLKLGLKLGKDLKRIPHKYGHICVRFFLTLAQLHPWYATVTSTEAKRSWDKQSVNVRPDGEHPINPTRPNQLFMFPYWWFHKSILLIVLYKHLKSCSKDFTLQKLIILTRLCSIGFISQHCWVVDFHPSILF